MLGDVQNLKGAKNLADEGFGFEKQQERLLMSKLAENGKLPVKPQTAFLQKKLKQQRKFFDSGDYAMNKQKTNPSTNVPVADVQNIVHKPASAATITQEEMNAPLIIDVSPVIRDESLLIPRPDTVPQRKSSIIYPSVHSKLSPQPYIHHSTHDSNSLPGS